MAEFAEFGISFGHNFWLLWFSQRMDLQLVTFVFNPLLTSVEKTRARAKLGSLRGRKWNKFKKGRWGPKRKPDYFELRKERTQMIRLMIQFYDDACLQSSLVDVTSL